ncbi:octopamine receptor beta-1R-like [Halichondria panicea]|uniref:octopamine receptor beta-1R-like n=1 Tax=Halichondria panicea TaxID=6063 RepID=UPI00312B8725
MNDTVGNVTGTCEELRLMSGPLLFSRTVYEVFRYVQITIFIIGFPLGLFLNTLVIVLVAKVKKLQQTSFYLALQVVVVDLLITLIQFPTTTANIIADGWVFGAIGCPSIGFFLFTLRNMRNFLMFVFVTDRFLTVFAPFWYYKLNHRNLVVVPLSVAAWFLAILYGLIPMPFGLDCHEYGRIAWGCTVSKGCKYPEICDAYKNASVVLSNVIGGLIPLVMYIVLYCKAKQLKKKYPTIVLGKVMVHNSLQKSGSTSSKTPDDRKQSVISSSSTSDQFSGSSSCSEKKRKRDETANITFALLFLTLIGVSFPSTFFFVIGTSAFSAQGIRPPEVFVIFITIFRSLFNFLVVLDPIAIMRNRDVRSALREWYQHLRYRFQGEARPIYGTPKREHPSENTSKYVDEKRERYVEISEITI